MGSYIERVLAVDEQIVYPAQLHWVIYLRGLMIMIVGALFGHFAGYGVTRFIGEDTAQMAARPIMIIALLIIIWGTIDLLLAYIRQMSTELVVTTRRVVAKYGFVSTTTFELMIVKVEGANIDQTVTGRILGFGTVLVKGTGGGISPIDHVANPFMFQNYLMTALEHATNRGPSGGMND